MVALALHDRLEGDIQPAKELFKLLELG